MKNTKISVLISFFNAEKYIYNSLNSITSQTYNNIEILLLDDGSKDDSLKIVNSFKDERISIFKNLNNKGLNFSINKLIDKATGEYIAIMDADDVASKYRIERQLIFLKKNKLDVCGTSLNFFGSFKNYKQTKLKEDKDIKLLMTFGNPMANPSILIKSDIIKKYKYSYKYISADYELWTRLALKNYKFGNCNEALLNYRVHDQQDSIIKYQKAYKESLEIAKNYSSLYFKNVKYSSFILKIDNGFIENIHFEKSKKAITAMNQIIKHKNASSEVLQIFMNNIIRKTYPINIKFIFFLSKFSKKYKIRIKKIYIIYLYMKIIFKFKNNNKLINRIINLYSRI